MPIDDELRGLIDGLLEAYVKWFQACKCVVNQAKSKLEEDKVPIPRVFYIRNGQNLLKGEDLVKGLVCAFLFA